MTVDTAKFALQTNIIYATNHPDPNMDINAEEFLQEKGTPSLLAGKSHLIFVFFL